jgi:hypothetical protein
MAKNLKALLRKPPPRDKENRAAVKTYLQAMAKKRPKANDVMPLWSKRNMKLTVIDANGIQSFNSHNEIASAHKELIGNGSQRFRFQLDENTHVVSGNVTTISASCEITASGAANKSRTFSFTLEAGNVTALRIE